MTARTALLIALLRGHRYGLELIDFIGWASAGTIKLKQGSVYPALRALERERLVRSWEADPTPERGGRPRRYYELTPRGRKAAREQAEALRAFCSAA